jgi:hypothetical protein
MDVDMTSFTNRQGWVAVEITPANESKAKEFRQTRDQIYGNIYQENATDQRWVGDLGEWCFNSYLNQQGLVGTRWINEQNASGKADFILPSNHSVGVKTVKRKMDPRSNYTAQITAQHANEPVDILFFLTYNFVERRMWLLGGISKKKFIANAKYYGAGEQVHENYTIRPNHEIYNVDLCHLLPPEQLVAFSKNNIN